MDGKLAAYRKEETVGKSQLDLILQVYDGAIAAFGTAKENYAANDSTGGWEHLERARKFVTHLYTTLNHEKGGDISVNLAKLYAWVINQINVAQATKDLQIIDDNITILGNLRDGWAGLKNTDMETTSSPTEAAPQGGFTHSA